MRATGVPWLRRGLRVSIGYDSTTFPLPVPADAPKLPINLEDLLRQRTVKRNRIEYKAGWNPDPTIRTL